MLHRPASLDELRSIVSAAKQLTVVGTGHSFSGIATGADLLTLDAMPREIIVGEAAVACSGNITYAELGPRLSQGGLDLPNYASLPHISVAGAIATGTHGSGDHNGNLATHVSAIELVTSDGEIVQLPRGHGDFDGMVVGLGALGVVTRLRLDCDPAVDIAQYVYEGLSWSALSDNFSAVFRGAYSTSVFTRWDDVAGDVWRKGPTDVDETFFDATLATRPLHPIRELDAANCTPQLGAPGPRYDRLPHFRIESTPSAGDQLQSEFFVERKHGWAAVEAIRSIADAVTPVLLVSEIRTVSGDVFWMSPHFLRESVAIHFTWTTSPDVYRVVPIVEDALAPFDARPHWGKLFTKRPELPLTEDFRALKERLDPRGVFTNDWLRQNVL